MIGENLLRFSKEQKYVLFDFETCNLNLVSLENKPWQISWIVATLNNIISKHNHIIKWDNLKVSKDAARITGFTPELIEQRGEDPKFVLDRLETYLLDPQYRLIAHNSLNFDFYVHNIYRRALGLKLDYSYLPRILDTNALARGYKMQAQPQPGEDLLLYQYRYANFHRRDIKTSMAQLCKDYQIEIDETQTHRAAYDVELLYEIWKKMIWYLEI